MASFYFHFTSYHLLKPRKVSPNLLLPASHLSVYVLLQAYSQLVMTKCSNSWNSLLLLSNIIYLAVSVLQTDASPWQSLNEVIHLSPQRQRGLTHNLATPLRWTCISPWPDAERDLATWSISVLCLHEQLTALPSPTSPSFAPLLPSASLQSLSWSYVSMSLQESWSASSPECDWWCHCSLLSAVFWILVC